MLGLGRRERAEVVLAEQERRRLGEPLLVERPRPPASAVLERRAGRAPPDPVAVAARERRVPRVEVRRRRLRGDDRDVVRQRRVRAPRPRAPAAGRPRLDARDLPERVHARVGAARDREQPPAREDRRRGRSRSSPSTVRRPGWVAQPWKPVPSYSSASLSRTQPIGSTWSVSPSASYATTSTSAPRCTPASQKAVHSSPATRTCPRGRHGATTVARRPTSTSRPTAGRRRFDHRHHSHASPTSNSPPTMTTYTFHGSGITKSPRKMATSRITARRA